MTTALIIGVDSTIGKALKKILLDAGWIVFGTTRRMASLETNHIYLDLSTINHTTNFSGSWINFKNLEIDVVYLCAAVTKIIECKHNADYSQQINVTAHIRLADYFLQKGARVIFLSSHAVFAGTKSKYKIIDSPSPVLNYGRFKAAVENALLQYIENITIVRLTKVLTKDHPLLIQWTEDLRQGKIIQPFYDLMVSPLLLSTVTNCLKEIAEKKTCGIIHLSGEEDVSYLQIAEALITALGLKNTLIQPKSIRESCELNYLTLPNYASLDTTNTKELFNMPDLSCHTTIHNLFAKL